MTYIVRLPKVKILTGNINDTDDVAVSSFLTDQLNGMTLKVIQKQMQKMMRGLSSEHTWAQCHGSAYRRIMRLRSLIILRLLCQSRSSAPAV